MTKTRKILSVLTSLTCLTSAVSVPAGATLFSEPADYESMFTYEKLDADEDGTYDFIRILKGGASATEVNIPDEIDGLPVTHIFDSAFYGIDTLKSINLPSSMINTGYMGTYNTNLEEINVAEGNTEFSSVDGVLFDKEKTILERYPSSKAGTEYTVPDSVTAIMGNAFWDCKNLKDITISENVNYIGNEAFLRCSSLESITFENPDCQFKQVNEFAVNITNGYVDGKRYFNGVIYGYKNSTAQAYAEKYDYKFEALTSTLLGDANGDNKINVRDCAFIAAAIAQGRTDELDSNSDFDNDSVVNVRDAASMAVFIAKK